MSRYAVSVRFTIHSGSMEAFLPQVASQAGESLLEEGCLEFQVWADPARPDEVFLWEVYTSCEAFRAHLDTPHFKRFDAGVRDLMAKKTVEVWLNQLSAEAGRQQIETDRGARQR